MRLNHLQPPFNNVELRRAVLGAVDQTDFLQGAPGNKDYAKVCKSFLPCGTPMSTGAGSEVMTGDLAAAKKAVAASGHDGTKAVILSAGDNPIVSACSNVTAELFRKIGITPIQVMGIATMSRRRTSMEPVADGGWSVFVAYGESAQFSNPSTHYLTHPAGVPVWVKNRASS